MGNPTDYVENTIEESLQLQQIGRNGNNPLQFEIGSFGLAAPDDDDVLVNVTTDWIGPTSQLAPVTTENKKEI